MPNPIAGDTWFTLKATIKTRGVVLDLTGCTAVVWLKQNCLPTVVGAGTVAIQSPTTAGKIWYTFAAGEFVDGTIEIQFKITNGSGKLVSTHRRFLNVDKGMVVGE